MRRTRTPPPHPSRSPIPISEGYEELREAEHLLHQLPESKRNRARARLELLQLLLAASRRQPINLLLEDL